MQLQNTIVFYAMNFEAILSFWEFQVFACPWTLNKKTKFISKANFSILVPDLRTLYRWKFIVIDSFIIYVNKKDS